MAAEKVRLAAEKATLLATLYGRALDARSPCPLLGDTLAAETVGRIDHDFRRTGITRRTATAVALRARFLDGWAREFLARHPEATVLHLGCGLDTRVHRLSPPPGVDWYDVDFPDVIELRRRLFPDRPGYTMVGASVTDPGWLARIPRDKPVLALAEGLVYYLDRDAGRALLRRIAEGFASGQIAFDALSRLGIRLQKLNTPVRKAGARMVWGIDGPADLLSISPRLRCVTALSAFDMDGYERLSMSARVAARVMKVFPSMKHLAAFYRLESGPGGAGDRDPGAC
ncbi:class I SAM-dependent methyltransferase [Nonomuraea lactucae]|uniref:class I SAM-dependent methyltransferase n=1 Tax=Nonomuraea lactucae TaxID=2249762 RepID=UPI000DE2E74B|nr:class I SAM-dependent methyltransferase [Nonomuraea lactucae]